VTVTTSGRAVVWTLVAGAAIGAGPYLAGIAVDDWGTPEGLRWRATEVFATISGWPPFAVGAVTHLWTSPFADLMRPGTGSSSLVPD